MVITRRNQHFRDLFLKTDPASNNVGRLVNEKF